MKKITFLIACLLAVFGMSAINHYDNLYVVGDACAAGWSCLLYTSPSPRDCS